MLQRDYFDHPDLGFALLPGFEGKGFAFEACTGYMEQAGKLSEPEITMLLAQFLPNNERSRKLLVRLGFEHYAFLEREGERLEVYKLNM